VTLRRLTGVLHARMIRLLDRVIVTLPRCISFTIRWNAVLMAAISRMLAVVYSGNVVSFIWFYIADCNF